MHRFYLVFRLLAKLSSLLSVFYQMTTVFIIGFIISPVLGLLSALYVFISWFFLRAPHSMLPTQKVGGFGFGWGVKPGGGWGGGQGPGRTQFGDSGASGVDREHQVADPFY